MKTLNNLSLTILAICFSSVIASAAILNKEICCRSNAQSTSINEECSNKLIRVEFINGELTPVVDLPEVVIYARGNHKSIYRTIIKDKIIIPVVDMPEVVITACYTNDQLANAVLYSGRYIPYINLPEVEIIAEKTNILAANVKNDNSEENQDRIGYYSPSVEIKNEKNLSDVVLLIIKSILF